MYYIRRQVICLHIGSHCGKSGKDRVVFTCEITDLSGAEISRAQTESRGGRIKTEIFLPGAKAWDPEHPVLYSMKYKYGDEEGSLRFGLRTLEFSPDRGLVLNGRVLKIKGVCLQSKKRFRF